METSKNLLFASIRDADCLLEIFRDEAQGAAQRMTRHIAKIGEK
jgi:hypothetical protein